ncbi:DUF3106 domain-containing protein [Luteimonas sp. BDR2-5]|uniref:DUF3106 domain-containing protein n=1 Tax=Proluteimonas luteida TaxID=2878685 RepID=UPI001E4E7D24|nr:DUF3106 domain-containing protein [Luteimonas sp. BDR2-5]MCD9028939.1 DUF3106 domain-containing protein [Luteimonas sp. BDR2-5]
MPMSARSLLRPLLLAALLPGMAGLALATPPRAPLPDWDRLDAAQREQLVAPVRERWNGSDAEERARMLDHARRWQSMTPEQRENARSGMHRWKHLPPAQQREARALYEKLRTLPEAERSALRERWRTMSPEQRRQWAADNPPPAEPARRGKP